MADEKTPSSYTRLADLKKLKPSLTHKADRAVLATILTALKEVVYNEELLTGRSLSIPLDDGQWRYLTASQFTRDGIDENEQRETLFWSDYANVLLELAQKFKNTSFRDELAEYIPATDVIKKWTHAPNASHEDEVDEVAVWEHRHEVAVLVEKLTKALLSSEAAAVTDSDDTDEGSTKDSPEETDREKARLAEEARQALAASSRENATAAVVVPPGAAGADSQPSAQPTTELDFSKLSKQEIADKFRKHRDLLVEYTLGQMARDQDIDFSALDPAARAQITALTLEFIESEGDFSFLFNLQAGDKKRAIELFHQFLQRKGISVGVFAPPAQVLKEEISEVLGDKNMVVDENILKTVDAIIVTHRSEAIDLLESLALDKQKLELIFGLEGYNLSEDDAKKLVQKLVNYARPRIAELTLYSDIEPTDKGIVGDQPASIEDSAALISSVRSIITTHSANGDGAGELASDAITKKPGSTSKKIQFALEQNQKIFGNYWQSLTPEEQAIALVALGTGYLVQKQHPLEGYTLPINIAELDPDIFRRHTQAIIDQQRMQEDALFDLKTAQYIVEYNTAVARAEALSTSMRAEMFENTPLSTSAGMAVAAGVDMQQLYTQSSVQELSNSEQDFVSSDAAAPSAPVSRVRNKLSKVFNSVSQNKDASNPKSGAVRKAAEKLLSASGIGAAAVAAYNGVEKVLGKKNTKRVALFLGGAAAAGAGYLLWKAIQTFGGMIGGIGGGIVGFVLGGPAGAFAGFVAGANAGAAAQSWFTGLFKGGASSGAGLSGGTGAGISFGAPTIGSGAGWGGGASSAGFSSGAAASTTGSFAAGSSSVASGLATGATGATNALGSMFQGASSLAQQAAAAVPTSASIGTSATAAAKATTNFLTSMPAITVGLGMFTPALLTFYVFLVIMGAFLAPMPFTITKGDPSASQYAAAVKVATPEKLENNTESTVSYSIELVPKAGYSLQLKRVTDTFSSMGGAVTVPTSPVSLASFETTPFTTKQETNYVVTVQGEDALLTNTVSFVFDVFDSSGKLLKQGESISAMGMVIIGNPPTGCFEFAPAGVSTPYTANGTSYTNMSEEWTQEDKTKFLRAFINRAGTNPKYSTLLCEKGTITVHKWEKSPLSYWGWAFAENKIGLYGDFFEASIPWMEYTLVHETGHIIDKRNPGLRSQFDQAKTVQTCFTYPFPQGCSSSEAFAEAIVDYVVWQTHSFNFTSWTGMFPFKTEYPVEYAWIGQNIFGGIEY